MLISGSWSTMLIGSTLPLLASVAPLPSTASSRSRSSSPVIVDVIATLPKHLVAVSFEETAGKIIPPTPSFSACMLIPGSRQDNSITSKVMRTSSATYDEAHDIQLSIPLGMRLRASGRGERATEMSCSDDGRYQWRDEVPAIRR